MDEYSESKSNQITSCEAEHAHAAKESTASIALHYVTEDDVRILFPRRPAECNKGDFGYVALIGGSIEYSGAIRLAALANAAMRSGAGVASIAAPRSVCPVIAGSILEATLIPLSEEQGELVFNEDEFARICRRYACIAFGMGIGNTAETEKAVRYLLENYKGTLIVDADGLNAMARIDRAVIRASAARLVLTPHVKEFARLSGMSIEDIREDTAGAASSLADELDAVVLLKGSRTVVAGPGQRDSIESESNQKIGSIENRTGSNAARLSSCARILATGRGCPGMATAGSGDVLSGILAAICVNADDLVLAAAAGAWINGAAGELAQRRRSDVTMTASDTAGCIAEVIETIIGDRI